MYNHWDSAGAVAEPLAPRGAAPSPVLVCYNGRRPVLVTVGVGQPGTRTGMS
jgi:hypothetical protein